MLLTFRLLQGFGVGGEVGPATDDGMVKWSDPFNKQSGAGKWQIKKDSLVFVWDLPSKNIESWEFPLAPGGAVGRTLIESVGYRFDIAAVKQA